VCGLAALLAPKGRVAVAAVEAMIAAQRHRGPDDRGVVRFDAGDSECWLASARLAVIDLSPAGHMPMADPVSGNCIAYNGEVYNFRELRRGLEAAGETFVSSSDTEVVLKLYRREGLEAVRRLRGMFAFALWDASSRELVLARDRAGKKPLYWFARDGVFACASEVRALLATGLVDRRLDPEALAVYLANGFPIAPQTMLRGVRSLQAGRWMRLSAAGQRVAEGSYWRPPIPTAGAADSERLLGVLREAVTLRRVSDVPLGVFLSGGLDSTAIAAALTAAGGDVRTFSITFDEPEYDESRFSRAVAKALHTRHQEVAIDRETLVDGFPESLAAADQPSHDGLNTWLVSRAARQGGLTVALSGLGADELFGGYPFFKWISSMASAGRVLRHLPKLALASPAVGRVGGAWKMADLQRMANGEAGPLIGSYQATQMLFPSWSRDALLHPDVARGDAHGLPPECVSRLRGEINGLDPTSAASLVAWRLFLGERCLRDTDAMSMSVSLEVRAPFVDHVFVEEAMSVPGRVRCAGAPDKPFEWKLAAPLIGSALRRRRKQGFIIPHQIWLKAPRIRSELDEVLRDGAFLASIGLRVKAVRALCDDFASDSSAIPWTRIWALFALADWCRRTGVAL